MITIFPPAFSILSIALLEKVLGKSGADLWKKSQGLHDGVVQPYHESKSISTENTFEENKTATKDKCVHCGKPASAVALFAKSY